MAIIYCSIRSISRGKGRLATALAAYCAGQRLRDLSTGRVFDHRRKPGVEHTQIILPTAFAADAAHWAQDRQRLWNTAEAAEKRTNARVAREYQLALPWELGAEARLALVRAFASEIANRHQVAVDAAIHAPHSAADPRNWHAHLLATTREIGSGGLGRKASPEWSGSRRHEAGLPSGRLEFSALRARWVALCNEQLQAAGHAVRIDEHKTREQAIPGVPVPHFGPAVTAMERRGVRSAVAERYRRQCIQAEAAKAARLLRVDALMRRIDERIHQASARLLDLQREQERAALQKAPLLAAPAFNQAPQAGAMRDFAAHVAARDLDAERLLALQRWAAFRHAAAGEPATLAKGQAQPLGPESAQSAHAEARHGQKRQGGPELAGPEP
jgi:ATP-dependent exoDNAse (exonuclease V) alpha subunit